MPNYRAPGVYVEETGPAPPPMRFAASHYAMLGDLGPEQKKPVVVASESEFARIAPSAAQVMRDAVRGFFMNGGRKLILVPLAIQAKAELLQSLAALGQTVAEEEPLALCAPGLIEPRLLSRLAGWCEDRKTAFAILDGDPEYDASGYDPRAEIGESSRAAIYQPWLLMLDADGSQREVPPSAFVMGVYARTEIERGIHHSPASADVRGIVGLTREILRAEQEILNPRSVNAIRRFDTRGTLVWGARTLDKDGSELRYVGTARLVTSVTGAASRFLGQFAFHENGPDVWAAVEKGVRNALDMAWRQGALAGAKASKAYFVACGLDTMTQHDIDTGRLICQIGIAPVRPAEFVIFRIAQSVQP